MIAQLQGTVRAKSSRSIILDVHGVGYRVFMTAEALIHIKLNAPLTLHTYLAVRDDALDLFGFETVDEFDYFTLLLTVPGIGPKSALAILSLAAPEVLRKAITAEDTSYLTRVSGIGQKNAEKIILTLKDKLTTTEPDTGEVNAGLAAEADALEALKSLGYSAVEAREALKKAGAGDTSARIKAALKALGNR
ncbi:MAG: Holliday junction branch migration protein RuvA [Candidatus Vogelbacteria bacterium]|nr:Holliday junction branch migration protein RuvA [Candidatus Vogelbacteria bacterium]